jgi:Down syndrome cell adhesion molecule
VTFILSKKSFQVFLLSLFLSFLLHIENIQNLAPQTRQKSIVEVSVDKGNKVHLPCNVQGNPVPTITWYRLSNSGSYYPIPATHRIIPSQSLLFIRNVDEKDAGRWVSDNHTL